MVSTVFLFLGINQPALAQEKKDKSRKELKKVETQKETKKVESQKESNNDVTGKTKDCKMVYAGLKGSFYYLTSGRNKIHVKEIELAGVKIVGKTTDVKTIFECPTEVAFTTIQAVRKPM